MHPNRLYSQDQDQEDSDIQSRWSIGLYFVGTSGGPCEDIEFKMREVGFDDRWSGWFRVIKDHPFSESRALAWMIKAEYKMRNWISIGFLSSKWSMKTQGYTNLLSEHIILGYSNMTYAPIISFYLFDYLNFGIGPSLNYISCSEIEYGANGEEKILVEEKNIGILTHVNIKIYMTESASFNLIFQYHFTGSTNIGPIVKEKIIGSGTPNPTTYTLTFPETTINFSHFFYGIGMGFHF
jgi:hypothetical protein